MIAAYAFGVAAMAGAMLFALRGGRDVATGTAIYALGWPYVLVCVIFGKELP